MKFTITIITIASLLGSALAQPVQSASEIEARDLQKRCGPTSQYYVPNPDCSNSLYVHHDGGNGGQTGSQTGGGAAGDGHPIPALGTGTTIWGDNSEHGCWTGNQWYQPPAAHCW